MNTTDLMRDPFYAGLMFHIERQIVEADAEARAKGVRFTDSNIKSLLVKLKAIAEGESPSLEAGNQKEELLCGLVKRIHASRAGVREGASPDARIDETKIVSDRDWLLGLKAVADSLKLRRSDEAGSRDYLDFLNDFIGKART
jgi:hypothetical protein